MKRAVIVHCWEANPEYCWYPWVKKELENNGFEIKVPAFPETQFPKQEKWVPCLAGAAGKPDGELILIGHSVGCITILRYLENLPENEKVGGVIMVAGFTDDLGYKELSNFFQTPIDFQKIKSKSKNGFIAIQSDNDPFVDLKYGDIFKKELGAEVITKHSMGHFSGPINDEKSCTKIPDVVEAVSRLLL